MRRTVDVVLGSVLAALATVVIAGLAVVGLFVFRTNPFFVQQRIGYHGRPFRLLKLRTLPPDVEPYAAKYDLEGVELTRYGRLLRKYHLDELPQLFHVPVGRMSLVGPRPEMPFLHDQLPDDVARERVAVRPGCTGLWQISVDAWRLIAEAPEYDRFYLAHRSWRLDLWILWRTALTMVNPSSPVMIAQVPSWARTSSVHPGDSLGVRDHA